MGAAVGGLMGAYSHVNTDVRNVKSAMYPEPSEMPETIESINGDYVADSKGWRRLVFKEAEYHQFKGVNVEGGANEVFKFVNTDGSEICWYKVGSEFVKVTDIGMKGTYNFIPFENTLSSALGHFFTDMVPFYMLDKEFILVRKKHYTIFDIWMSV